MDAWVACGRGCYYDCDYCSAACGTEVVVGASLVGAPSLVGGDWSNYLDTQTRTK